MSKDNINKFLGKNILVKPILVVTNDKDIFAKYFNVSLDYLYNLSLIKKENKNYN